MSLAGISTSNSAWQKFHVRSFGSTNLSPEKVFLGGQDYTRRLREEQDAEYSRSLQADQAREREREQARLAAEAEAKAAADAQRRAR